MYPVSYPGVVHLNVPFRDPLAPIPQPGAEALKSEFSEIDFFTGIANIDPTLLPAQAVHPGARPEVRIQIVQETSRTFLC